MLSSVTAAALLGDLADVGTATFDSRVVEPLRSLRLGCHTPPTAISMLRDQDCEVVQNRRTRVKINTKLTNFKIKPQIEGYSGE